MGQAVRDTLKTFGAIDVLVNNAGHGYRGTIEESEPEAVRELFETNFFGPMELVRQVLLSMRAKKRGMIINVTSIGAVRGALQKEPWNWLRKRWQRKYSIWESASCWWSRVHSAPDFTGSGWESPRGK